MSLRSLPVPPLLLITDRTQARGDLAEVVARACAGGCRWVSLREKDLPAQEQVGLFARLRAATRPFGARLTLHGAAALAAAAGADGVHLPDGGDPREARALLGADALVGLSLHLATDAATVDPEQVDYVTASPVFLTASKPGYGPALGVDGLAAFVAAASVPVIALGGIEADNVPLCLRAGAAGAAVMGGVMRAQDPEAAVADLLAAFAEPPA